jgi:hypothetical protein
VPTGISGYFSTVVQKFLTVFSLDASGSLVITTTRSGPGDAPPSISATTYKRTP